MPLADVPEPSVASPSRHGRSDGASDGPLRILIVSRFSEQVGGAETRLYRFLDHLDRSRVDLAVAFLGPGAFERKIREHGFRTHVVPPVRLRQVGKSLRTIGRLRQVLKRESPDLIVSWGSKAQILTSPAAVLAGLRSRAIWWQLDIPSGKLEARLATLLPGMVACSSNYVAEAQRRRWPRRRTFVVHPGIDPPKPVPAEQIEAIRTSLAIPPGRFVIGTVSRLESRKRQDVLIRATSLLRGRGHDVHALLVGGDPHGFDPDYVRSLHELVDELGVGEAVSFTGEVPDPSPYLVLMDVFALPCAVEAFGNALIEAMGAGLPCVAVGIAGPSEIIEDGHSGVLVADANADLFADAIHRLIADEAMREQLAEGGKRRQREFFSASRMTEELESQLDELAASLEHR